MGFNKAIQQAVKSGAVKIKEQEAAAAASAKDTADRTAALRSMRRLDEEDAKKMGLKKGGKVKLDEMKMMKKKRKLFRK